jgi:crotonobetainyl-CoA:carnitine CoA-transferase CaiB-like acyl-CoA transferase
MTGGALSHLRVLDLSRVLAGPWGTQVLADLGADVIKVERPGRGDDTRQWGPPYLRDAAGAETGESAYFLAANRGKKSVTIDFSTTRGQDLVRTLISRSDVLVENFRPGALERYGLDYAALATDYPRLVYCSITGFGQTGPYRDRPGYDFTIQALGGLMSLTGEPAAAGGGPQKAGVALADILTGLYAAIAVLAALAHRDRTGVGQHIDLGLLDVQVACLANQAMNHLVSGAIPSRLGNAHPNIVPYQAFMARDREIVIAVGNDEQFIRLCRLTGRPALAGDERFATNAARVRHRAALVPLLGKAFRERDGADWIAGCVEAGIPAGLINDLGEVFEDAQVRHRGLRLELPHPLAGVVPLVASPLRLSATPVGYGRPPPTLGQHTAEVLAEVGLGPEEIASLREDGII